MNNDMTSKSEWKAILFFSIPIMGSQLLQMFYNLADSIIVGNFVGSNGLGAVGVTSSASWLLLNLVTGLSSGASIVISQYIGASRKDDISATVSTTFTFSIFLSFAVTALCFIFANSLIIGFLGTPVEMQAEAYSYFVIYSLGIIFQMIYNVTYGILRAYGDSKGSLLFLLVAAILNVALDLVFVIFFKWGVAGAAAATIISQAGSAVASSIYMWHKLPDLRLNKIKWVFDMEKLKIVLKLAVPIVIQSSIIAFGFIILQRLVNSFGPASIEGYFVLSRVEQILHIPSNSFNIALSSFTGQNIGAGNIDRIKKGYKSTLYMGCLISAVLIILMLFTGKSWISWFNVSPEASKRGVEHLNVLASFMIINTAHNITVGLLQGAGDVKIPAIAGFINLSVRLVVSYAMAATAIDYRSIFYSIPFAWISAFAITIGRYRSGKWQNKSVIQQTE